MVLRRVKINEGDAVTRRDFAICESCGFHRTSKEHKRQAKRCSQLIQQARRILEDESTL